MISSQALPPLFFRAHGDTRALSAAFVDFVRFVVKPRGTLRTDPAINPDREGPSAASAKYWAATAFSADRPCWPRLDRWEDPGSRSGALLQTGLAGRRPAP